MLTRLSSWLLGALLAGCSGDSCQDAPPTLDRESASPPLSETIEARAGERLEFRLGYETGELSELLAVGVLDWGLLTERTVATVESILPSENCERPRSLELFWSPVESDVGNRTFTLFLLRDDAEQSVSRALASKEADADSVVWTLRIAGP